MTVETANHEDKPGNSGCLVLFLLAIPVVDTLGYLMSQAGPYSEVMLPIGLSGFACGAGMGVYVSVKVKRQPWWSSCRWAIYGLVGMCLLTFMAFAVLLRWR